MGLVRHNIVRLSKKLKKKGIRMLIQGRAEPAPKDVLERLLAAEEETKDGKNGTVCICFNYGGHWEIADAATKLLQDESLKTTTITPEIFAKYLYQPEVPPCDLIVRTSGEERISGFQLWRAAYSEFLFLDKYFPDMELSDLDDIIAEFNSRKRRFGK